MQRLRDDRGAVGVVVAFLMVALLGFAALSLDISAAYEEQQQLQVGADAAALAIAQDCARGDCGPFGETAAVLADANLDDDADSTAVVTDPALGPATGTVTVENSSVREHWFAPVLGIAESNLRASATAAWGYPTGGTSMLPLALHECEFEAQVQAQGGTLESPTPTMLTILRSKDLTNKTELPADWPCEQSGSGNPVPGGFGWLDTDPGTCWARTDTDDDAGSDPGNSIPSSCDLGDLVALRDKTLLLPLFDTYGGTGQHAWFNIVGYAAFTLKGYDVTGKSSDAWGVPCPATVNTCLSGYFQEYVDLTNSFSYSPGAPSYGAAVVALTK